jgi:hypothetical protein
MMINDAQAEKLITNSQTPQTTTPNAHLRVAEPLVRRRRLAPREAVVRRRRERRHLADQPHDLLVLDLPALVDMLPRERGVLLGVAGGKRSEAGQQRAHRVRVVGQRGEALLDRDGERCGRVERGGRGGVEGGEAG